MCLVDPSVVINSGPVRKIARFLKEDNTGDLIEHCWFPSLLATLFQKKIIFQPVDIGQSESLLGLNRIQDRG